VAVIVITRNRRNELIAKMLEVLFKHPGGLPFRGLLEHIEASVSLSQEELAPHQLQPALRCFEEAVWMGTIAPVKAGWLRNDRDHMSLTESGRRAFETFRDPSQLIAKAARRSARGWLSINAPRAYRMAARIVDQLLIEYRLVRRVGLRDLAGKTLGNTNRWEAVLPLQTAQRFVVDLNLSPESVTRYLDSIVASYMEGGHTIYLPPETARRSVFRALMHNYPGDAGIKLIKNPGGVDEGHYLREGYGVATGESVLHRNMVHDHAHLSLVANLLYNEGIGPRLYDLVEIQGTDSVSTAYIVAHSGAQVPSVPECEAGLRRIAQLEKQKILKINLPDGLADEDFEPPACNGNALMSPDGKFHYIDFQNFTLANYQVYLEKIAIEATQKSHFGDQTLLRGGRYLYQSVPGVPLPSRRKIEDRIVTIRELMETADLSVEQRLVLDFGCNIGMMMGQYLKLGAAWCHGWDRALVVPHTERLLLALGCSRFSTTGCDIEASRPVEVDLPEFLQPLLKGSVISYLAVRGHLGWLDALSRIPWAFLIYEGHEEETPEQFESFVAELGQQARFKVGDVRHYRDGDSDPRTLAVLVREENFNRSEDLGEPFAVLRKLKDVPPLVGQAG
jgi:hypothetical protein